MIASTCYLTVLKKRLAIFEMAVVCTFWSTDRTADTPEIMETRVEKSQPMQIVPFGNEPEPTQSSC